MKDANLSGAFWDEKTIFPEGFEIPDFKIPGTIQKIEDQNEAPGKMVQILVVVGIIGFFMALALVSFDFISFLPDLYDVLLSSDGFGTFVGYLVVVFWLFG